MPLQPASRQALSTFRARILPVLACALLARAYLSIACWYAGLNPWTAREWGRWDSQNYVTIATLGYTDTTHGWFPGYAWLLRPFIAIGLDAWFAGALVSFLFFLGTLFLIWNYILEARPSLRNLLCLLLASFFPGHVYFQASFPISTLTFFTLLLFILLTREKWISASFAGAAGAVSYTTGCLLAPIVALWLLIFHGRKILLERKILLLAPPLGITLGFLLVMAVQDVSAGVVGSFFRAHERIGFAKLSDPISVLKQVAIWPLNKRSIMQEWNRERFSLRASNGRLVGTSVKKQQEGDQAKAPGTAKVELELTAYYKKYSPGPHSFGKVRLADGTIALEVLGRVVRAGPDRPTPTVTYDRQISPSERLKEIKLEGDRLAFQTGHGTYLGIDKSMKIISTATSLGERETFVKERSRGFFARYPIRSAILALQTLVVCGSGLVAITVLAVANRKSLALHGLILIHALVYLVFPLSQGASVNHYRAESLLLLLVIPVRNAGVTIQLLLAVAYLALSFPVAVLFFQGVIT